MQMKRFSLTVSTMENVNFVCSLSQPSDEKFCIHYCHFYKPINIEEIDAWINSGMSYL